MVPPLGKPSVGDDGRGPMGKSLRVEELSDDEVKELESDSKFRSFGPWQCSDCGHKGPFRRRLYRIHGKYELTDDAVQDAFRRHMYQHHGLGNIFFRTIADTGYVDTAFCGKCDSNLIVYDLLMLDAAKFLVDKLRSK